MSNKRIFFRFSGRLWENMTFEKKLGWETSQIAHEPQEGDGTYSLELKDKQGSTLVSVSPSVDFNRRCRSSIKTLRYDRITAYIPVHEKAEKLVFRRGEMILYEEEISPAPPKIHISELKKIGKAKVSIEWSADHPQGKPLRYNVMYIPDEKQGVLLSRGLAEKKLVVDLSRSPGSNNGRILVVATDGTRSAFDISSVFQIPFKPPSLWIQRPYPNQVFSADQPVSLCGAAFNISGIGLPDEGLVWRVDEEVKFKGVRLASIESLQPGRHKIALEYVAPGNKKLQGRQEIIIRILVRNKKQEEYWKSFEKIKVKK